MTELALTSCARPTLTKRRWSTYTVMGFTGYIAANIVGSVLASAWQLSLAERLTAFLVPPLAFIIVVTIATAIVGRERIVFYQTACAGVVGTAVVAAVARLRGGDLVDIATIGIGVFLVFGRVGCFSVACCHGTLGRGVAYGPAHVAIGFWRRWQGRALWPVQLVEAGGSLALVVLALALRSRPGDAAFIYIEGYAAMRFALELVRGDSARPQRWGVSEAQWLALATAVACSVWRPSIATIALAALLALATGALAARRHRRELVLPPHLRELDAVMMAASDGTRHETSLGVAASCHALPDGRTDWVLSSTHPAWSAALVRTLAIRLWSAPCEIVPGRAAGVMHVIAPS